MNTMLKDKRAIFLLVAPGMLLLIGFIFIPISMSLYYSLTDWNSGSPNFNFVGLQNYIQIFTQDKIFLTSLLNSVVLGLALILIQHPLGIAIAMLIQYTGKWEKFLRIVIFIPSVISTFVSTKLWSNIFNTQFGFINQVLGKLGLYSWQLDWLGERVTAIAAIIIVAMWTGFGYCFILYYAGVKGVPDELLEASTIDGATRFQTNLHIILPLLKPIIRVNIVLAVISAFKQMEIVYLLTQGGPANSTQFLSTYLYSKAFRESLYGYGNAISILLLIICLVITVILNSKLQSEVGE